MLMSMTDGRVRKLGMSPGGNYVTKLEFIETFTITQARQILTKLFNGERILFIPTRSSYELRGVAAAGKLLGGGAKGLVSPTGI